MSRAVGGVAPGRKVAESVATATTDRNFERRRRIRKWLIVTALIAFTAFVYITAMVKMAEVHQFAHFM